MTDKTSPEYLAYKGKESLADRLSRWFNMSDMESLDPFIDEISELEAERDGLKKEVRRLKDKLLGYAL